jgi:hypothetical protein
LAEQRHPRHVPEQAAGDDRGRPFQPVYRDAQVAHHVDQDTDHDIGVQRGQ